MRRKLVLLELVYYDHYDEIDQVDVEDKFIIGYFFDIKRLEYAIKLCEEQKEPGGEIKLTGFDLKCKRKQISVFVLSYQYTIVKGNNQYDDFYEYFEPQISYRKCLKQKKKLLKLDKYKETSNRVFEDSEDGFIIAEAPIDDIDHVFEH